MTYLRELKLSFGLVGKVLNIYTHHQWPERNQGGLKACWIVSKKKKKVHSSNFSSSTLPLKGKAKANGEGLRNQKLPPVSMFLVMSRYSSGPDRICFQKGIPIPHESQFHDKDGEERLLSPLPSTEGELPSNGWAHGDHPLFVQGKTGKFLQRSVCVCMHVISRVQLFVTSWTIALQALLSTEFSRQEYWSGFPFPSPEDLPDPGIKPGSLASLASAGRFFTTVPAGKPSPIKCLMINTLKFAATLCCGYKTHYRQ